MWWLLVILGLLLSAKDHVRASNPAESDASHEYFYEYYEDDDHAGSEVPTHKFRQYLKEMLMKNRSKTSDAPNLEAVNKSTYNHRPMHHHSHQPGKKLASINKHGWPKENITSNHGSKFKNIGKSIINSTETANYKHHFDDIIKRSEHLETYDKSKSQIQNLTLLPKHSINYNAKGKSHASLDVSENQKSFFDKDIKEVNHNTSHGNLEVENNYSKLLPKLVKLEQKPFNSSSLDLSKHERDFVGKNTEGDFSGFPLNTSRATSDILNSNETANNNQLVERLYKKTLSINAGSSSKPITVLPETGAFDGSGISRIQNGLPIRNTEDKTNYQISTHPPSPGLSGTKPTLVPLKPFNKTLDSSETTNTNIVHPFRKMKTNVDISKIISSTDRLPSPEIGSNPTNSIDKELKSITLLTRHKQHNRKITLHADNFEGADAINKYISKGSTNVRNKDMGLDLIGEDRLISKKDMNLPTELSSNEVHKDSSNIITNFQTKGTYNYSPDKILKNSINTNSNISFLPKPLVDNYNNNLELLKSNLKRLNGIGKYGSMQRPSIKTENEFEKLRDDLNPNNINGGPQINKSPCPCYQILEKKSDDTLQMHLPTSENESHMSSCPCFKYLEKKNDDALQSVHFSTSESKTYKNSSNEFMNKIGSHMNLTILVSSILKDIRPVGGGKYIYVPSNPTPLISDTSDFDYSEPQEFDILLNHIISVMTKNIYGKTIKRRKLKRLRKKDCNKLNNCATENKTMEAEHIRNSNNYETGGSVIYNTGLVESETHYNDNNSEILILDDIKDLGDGQYTLTPSSAFSINDTTTFNYTSPHPLEELLEHLAHVIYTNMKQNKITNARITDKGKLITTNETDQKQKYNKTYEVQGNKNLFGESEGIVENVQSSTKNYDSKETNGSVVNKASNYGGRNNHENKETQFAMQNENVQSSTKNYDSKETNGSVVNKASNYGGRNNHENKQTQFAMQNENVQSSTKDYDSTETNGSVENQASNNGGRNNHENKETQFSMQNKTIKPAEVKLNYFTRISSYLENNNSNKGHEINENFYKKPLKAFSNDKIKESNLNSTIHNSSHFKINKEREINNNSTQSTLKMQQNIVTSNRYALTTNTTSEKPSNIRQETQRFTDVEIGSARRPRPENYVHKRLSSTRDMELTVGLKNKRDSNLLLPGTPECIIENINAKTIFNVHTSKDKYEDKLHPNKANVIRVIIKNNTTKDFAVDIISNNTIVVIKILEHDKTNTKDNNRKTSFKQNKAIGSKSQENSKSKNKNSPVPKTNRSKSKLNSDQNTKYDKDNKKGFDKSNLNQDNEVNNPISTKAQPVTKLKKVIKVFKKKTVEEKKIIETFT